MRGEREERERRSTAEPMALRALGSAVVLYGLKENSMPENTDASNGGSQEYNGPDRRRGSGPRPDWAEGHSGVLDRRLGVDRRVLEAGFTGLERRRGAGRRLSEAQRAAEEGQMTKEQFMFLVAIDEFKKANQTQFPTWTDVLEVIRLLGYRKTCASELNLKRAEDWMEGPGEASNVRPPRWAERFTERRQRPAA
jgi:hypothetical protein